MALNDPHLTCIRCNSEFDLETPHTKIVRRDFVESPRPAVIEHLCADCWRAYVEDFLERDQEFEIDAVTT